MKKIILLISLSLLLASSVWAAPEEPQVVLDSGGSSVIWYIDGFDYGLAELTVTGPKKIAARVEADRFESPKFTAVDDNGKAVDGLYRWNLTVRSYLDRELLDQITEARLANKESFVCELQEAGILQDFSFSGTFIQVEGKVILPTDEPEEFAPEEALADRPEKPADGEKVGQAPTKDFVIADDLIVDGSACIGFDCVNGESFGFDTIRLKENNLRIKFDDTSTAASYPRTDWQLRANASANGGASEFAIDDITSGRTPFAVEANAPSRALHVDDGGRIGLGTSTPVADIHAVDGDTPTLRLEQNGSSGFAPQTWDVAGNETSFFVRDASNGSTLPFRIRPGAPSQALVIDEDGEIGVGILSADASVHIRTTDDSGQLLVEDTGASGNLDAIRIENNNKVTIVTVAGSDRWDFSNDGNFNISKSGTGVNEFSLNDSGTLTIRGSLIAQGGDGTTDPGDTFPDYVFAPEYELMSLEDLESFVTQNRHLPNVPSASDISAAGGINMTELQLRMLEKVEELTLYTLSQERTIQSQNETIRELTERLEALESGSSN